MVIRGRFGFRGVRTLFERTPWRGAGLAALCSVAIGLGSWGAAPVHAAATSPEFICAAPGLEAIDGLPPLQEPNRTALLELLQTAAAHTPLDPGEQTTTAPNKSANRPPAADRALFLAKPATVRGARFWVEGRYAGRERQIELGGETVREWGVLVTGPKGVAHPLVIYLPAGGEPAPPTGARVRGKARFLSLWDDRNAAGEAVRYPVLVAAELRTDRAASANPNPWMPRLVILLVILTAVAWWLSRRLRATPRQRTTSRAFPARAAAALSKPAGPTFGFAPEPTNCPAVEPELPQDPAKALAELARRAEQTEQTKSVATDEPTGKDGRTA